MYCKLDEVVDSIIDRELFRDTGDFGSMCPENWEEIGEFLRCEIGKRCDQQISMFGNDIDLLDRTRYGQCIFDEICCDVWEDFCGERIPNCPESIFDE